MDLCTGGRGQADEYVFQTLSDWDKVVHTQTHVISAHGAPCPKDTEQPEAPEDVAEEQEPPPVPQAKNARDEWVTQMLGSPNGRSRATRQPAESAGASSEFADNFVIEEEKQHANEEDESTVKTKKQKKAPQSVRAVLEDFTPLNFAVDPQAFQKAIRFIREHCQKWGCEAGCIAGQRKPLASKAPNATVWTREYHCGYRKKYNCTQKKHYLVNTNGIVHIEHKGVHNSHSGASTGGLPTTTRGVLPHIVRAIALPVSWGITGAAQILKHLEALVQEGVNLGHLPTRLQITSIVQRWRLAMVAEGHRNTFAGHVAMLLDSPPCCPSWRCLCCRPEVHVAKNGPLGNEEVQGIQQALCRGVHGGCWLQQVHELADG